MNWNPLSQKPMCRPNDMILVWHVYLECVTDTVENLNANRFYTHWQEAPTDGWIRVKDRQPTQEDADAKNCILVADEQIKTLKVTGWFQTQYHREYTMWMPTPEGPPKYKELKKLY